MQFIFSKRNKNGCKGTAFLSYMQENSKKSTKNLHISQFFSTSARLLTKIITIIRCLPHYRAYRNRSRTQARAQRRKGRHPCRRRGLKSSLRDSRAPTLPAAIPPRNPTSCRWHLVQRKKERFACLSKLRQTNRPFFFAESEGFEPPIRRNAYTAFRVRLFRPLRQLSY